MNFESLQLEGFNLTVTKSIELVATSNELAYSDKRNLIHSLYALFSVYDNGLMEKWRVFLEADKNTSPEKLDPYFVINRVINLENTTAELKALWYLFFPLIIYLDCPFDEEIYDELVLSLQNDEVLDIVLYSNYSILIKDTVEELEQTLDTPGMVVEWYTPFIIYKSQTDNKGETREVIKLKKWLAEGKFSDVFYYTQKLLNSFPEDDNLILLNIAARIPLSETETEEQKIKTLKQILTIIDEALKLKSDKKIFFHYYAALVHIALKNPNAAKSNLIACLQLDKTFTQAEQMLTILSNNK